MYALASYMEEASLFKDYGLHGTENLKLDFKEFKNKRDAYVKKLNGIYDGMLNKSGVTYVEGTAKFVDKKTIEVEGERYTGKTIMIASGSTPQVEGFEGIEHCMDSNGFFEMEELPESCAVIGGGYIGIELAQILQALGCKTTLIVRSVMLRFLDEDIVKELHENMTKLHLDVKMPAPHEKVSKEENGQVTVHLQGGEKVTADKCLVALGRPPNTGPLNLGVTDVKLEKGGYVQVDEY
jgi:glutathione reductase (NADPH)